MTKYSQYLQDLGRRIIAAHADMSGLVAATINGSAAEGHSDDYSDLDMTMYYDVLPSQEHLTAARSKIDGAGPIIWTIGDPNEGDFAHAFKWNGIEVQIGHVTVAQWEKDMNRILAGEEPGSPLHKAMSGTVVGVAVIDEDRIEKWKAKLRDYPQTLRETMVRHHLTFFPTWALQERQSRRDANLWARQSMVDASFNILGALAGLNRKYFTSFQFKRAKSFIDSMEMKPKNLHARLDALWTSDLKTALEDLKNLIRETVELIEREMPQVDTKTARKILAREDKSWTFTATAG